MAAESRVALLSPYTGTNLGDFAIHEATIQGFRERRPGIQLVSVTLDSARTAALHSVEGFPLTGLPVPFYWNPAGATQLTEDEGAVRSGTSPVRNLIKALPVAGPMFRRFAFAGRRLATLPAAWRHRNAAARFVAGLDMVVVAGGGQLDDEWGGTWGQPWVLNMWAHLARSAGVPFVILSTGLGRMDHRLSRIFLRGALRRAAYRSYRDVGSRDLAAALGADTDGPVVADLAFSFSRTGTATRVPGRVGLSPIAFRHPQLSARPNRDAWDRYRRQLAALVRGLLGVGHEVVLFSSCGPDRVVVDDLYAEVASETPEGRVRAENPNTAGDLLQIVGACDGIIASRLHAVTLAHLADQPVVALSYDRKVAAHMRDMGQEMHCFAQPDAPATAVLERFRGMMGEADHVRSAVRASVAAARASLDRQYDAVVALLPDSAEGGA